MFVLISMCILHNCIWCYTACQEIGICIDQCSLNSLMLWNTCTIISSERNDSVKIQEFFRKSLVWCSLTVIYIYGLSHGIPVFQGDSDHATLRTSLSLVVRKMVIRVSDQV